MMRKALFIFCAAFLSVSCNVADKFSVIEAGPPVFNGLTSVHGKAVAENGSRRDFVVESAELRFSYKKRELATARLMLPVALPAMSVSGIRYDLKLESESITDLQTLRNRMDTNPAQVFVDIRAQVRYGRVRKTVDLKGVPYFNIIANFERLEKGSL